MSGIDSYSITPATNATADGGAINWAEGQPPSSVNNTARQWMADTRTRHNDLIWFQYGIGDQGAGNIAVPSVYASGTSFTITGADVTLIYERYRRVRAVGVSTGTIYGTIISSSYNSGNTKTTVNVAWDSGSLSNETLVISLSQIPATGLPAPIFSGVGTPISRSAYNGTVASSGTLDLDTTAGNASFSGFLTVSSVKGSDANFRTQTQWAISGRATTEDGKTSLNSASGTGSMSFTISYPSAGVIRVTNGDAASAIMSMGFFGVVGG